MKIACVYHPRRHHGCGKFHFVHDALTANGHDVYHVETMQDLVRADQACDLVLHEQRGPASLCLPDFRDFLPHRKSLHFQWYFDLNVFDDSIPLEKQAPIEEFLPIMRQMDMVFVKEQDRVLDYLDIGVNAVWLDQGCPSNMRQAELIENPVYDVILWGSSSRNLWRQRWNDVETLVQNGFVVAWASTDGNLPAGIIRLPGVQPLEIPDLVEKAAVTLVVNARDDVKGYWSDRIWLAAGAGACIVRRAGMSGGNLPGLGYFTGSSLCSLVGDMCDKWQDRKQRGAEARRFTMQSHTYEQRVRKVVKYAQDIIDKRSQEPAVSGVSGNKEDRAENKVGEGERTAMSGV